MSENTARQKAMEELALTLLENPALPTQLTWLIAKEVIRLGYVLPQIPAEWREAVERENERLKEDKEVILGNSESLAARVKNLELELSTAKADTAREILVKVIGGRSYPEDGDGLEFFFTNEEWAKLLNEYGIQSRFPQQVKE